MRSGLEFETGRQERSSLTPRKAHREKCPEAPEKAGGGYTRSVATLAPQYRKFFGAAIASTLLLQATVITDTILVGQLLGTIPMSGVRVASPIVNVLNVIAFLIGVGGSTIASVAMGRRDRESANRAFTVSIVLGLAVGALLALIVVPLAGPLAQLISSDESTVEYTATFLGIVAAASPAYLLATIMTLFLRADAHIRLSSVVLAAAGVINVCCDLLYMGALGMGIEGSALATDTGMVVAVLISLLYFRWPKRTLRLTGGVVASVRSLVGPIVKNGAPGALRMLFACISLLFLNYIVGNSVGVLGIAMLTVCGNIQLLATAFFSAGGQAAMPMEGVLYGERDFNGLRLLVRYVFRVILTCVAVLVAVSWLIPAQIIGLFVPGGIEGGDWLLRLYAIGFVPLAINYILTYYYNIAGQRKIATTLTLCENPVFYLPLIWLLTTGFGLVGAIAAFPAAEFAATLVTLAMVLAARARGGFSDLLLIPDTPREVVFEATVPASELDASGIAREVKHALDEQGVEADVSLRAAMGVEEMVVNAATYEPNAKRSVSFDVSVSALPESVQVVLHDNGAPFDPTHREPAEQGEFDNVSVLLAIASRVEYRNTLGLNQTVVEVKHEG